MQANLNADEVLGFQRCRGCALAYALSCLHPTIGGYVLCTRCLQSRTGFYAQSKARHGVGAAHKGRRNRKQGSYIFHKSRKYKVVANEVTDEAVCSLVQEMCELVGFDAEEVAGINTREGALSVLTNLTHVAAANPFLAAARTDGPLSLSVLFPTDVEELPAPSRP